MAFLQAMFGAGALQLSSLMFPLFVLLFLIIYFALQRTQFQQWIILAADITVVYVMSGLRSVLTVMLVCLVDFVAAIWIERLRVDNKKRAKLIQYLAISFTLIVLIFFKFFTHPINEWIEQHTVEKLLVGETTWFRQIMVPIGLSYYILSMAAYLSDVGNKKCDAERNYASLLGFMLYFPALIEGPFNLYKKLSEQLKSAHTYESHRVISGAQRVLWGYFKKKVIADRIGIMVGEILDDPNSAGVTVFICMAAYSFQLYADFAGGIDVIMGISEIMGIELPENFKSPMLASSVTDYWQRWHKSLGTIMEKYVYYPIVLSKKMRNITKRIGNKYLRTVFAATVSNFFVFILVGIWHGTGWNYVVYGLYQGFFTSMAILLKPYYTAAKSRCHINENSLVWKIFTIVRTFILLIFGRLIIKATNLSEAGDLIRRMFSEWNPRVFMDGSLLEYGLDIRGMIIAILGVILMLVVDIMHEKGFMFREWLNGRTIVLRYVVYMVVIYSIILLGIYGSEMRLIYAQY